MPTLIWNIPRVGTQVRLLKDWKFDLYEERRNWGAFDYFGIVVDKTHWHRDNPPPHKVTFKKDTKLQVDRVYIRGSGYDDFNSLTFRVVGLGKVRFWAKLEDVRNMEVEGIQF